MRNSIIQILLVLIILTSCKESKYHKETESLARLINKLSNDKIEGLKRKYYLLIPLEGCSYCIKYAIDFAKKNANNKNFLFVVSHYDSKVIRSALKNHQKNVIIDSRSEALNTGLMTASPTLITVVDNNIRSITFLGSENIHEILSDL